LRAFITGITGQDGSYLADLLLGKGYEVHGLKRRASSFNTERIDHLVEGEKFHLHYGDITDGAALSRLIHEIEPDEVYNLAAQSHVGVSFECPKYTAEVVGLGCLNVLEACRPLNVRVYQASTSEMYGNTAGPLNEGSSFAPVSPYGIAKLYAHNMCVNYRQAFGMKVSCGILFNHESPRRGPTFVTKKITDAARAGKCVFLGNLDAKRDWGHAKDYVEGMWRMLQVEADDFVLATGQSRSVRSFLKAAHEKITFEGHGALEVAYDTYRKKIAAVNVKYYRPVEIHNLVGDASKAEEILGWKPEISFEDMVEEMVDTP